MAIKKEFKDTVDDLGRIYILILFISGAIWAFIAVNNFNNPPIFRLALTYSLLLIFGFLGISYDRNTHQLGIDSKIWNSDRLKSKLAISSIVLFLWYLVFFKAGFSIATAQSVTGVFFSVSPTLNWFLTTVLGPLAENVFFFGVINMTLITLIKRTIENKKKTLILAGLIVASSSLFTNVPNSFILLIGSAGILVLATLTQNKFLLKHAPIISSALFIGGVVFPKFHSFAYQLFEKHYIAATIFGIIACVLSVYIGIMVGDIFHVGANMMAVA